MFINVSREPSPRTISMPAPTIQHVHEQSGCIEDLTVWCDDLEDRTDRIKKAALGLVVAAEELNDGYACLSGESAAHYLNFNQLKDRHNALKGDLAALTKSVRSLQKQQSAMRRVFLSSREKIQENIRYCGFRIGSNELYTQARFRFLSCLAAANFAFTLFSVLKAFNVV